MAQQTPRAILPLPGFLGLVGFCSSVNLVVSAPLASRLIDLLVMLDILVQGTSNSLWRHSAAAKDLLGDGPADASSCSTASQLARLRIPST